MEELTGGRERAKALVEALRAGNQVVVLDVGASKRRRGTITLDLEPFEGVDLVWNLVNGLPFEDDVLDGVKAFHILEHLPVELFQPLFAEIWRVCRPGAEIHIKTPHYSCGYMAWSDPTHVRPYGLETFLYHLCATERGHSNALFSKLPAFEPISVDLRYYAFSEDRKVRLSAVANIIDAVANSSRWVQRQFERRICYLIGGFEEVDAKLRVAK